MAEGGARSNGEPNAHAEEALAQANEQLRAVLRASPLAVVALDLEGRVELWNPAAEAMFGWTEEEVIGNPPRIVPPEGCPTLEQARALAARGLSWTGAVAERIRKDGSRVEVSASTAPLHDAAGQPRGMILLLEDVTERRRAEEEQRRLAAIMEATTDIVWTADPEGRLLYLNHAGREILGRAVSSGVTVTEHLPEWAAGELLREAIPAAIRDGSWRGESAILSGAGEEIPVSQVIVAHRNAHGEVEYLSTVTRDISERKVAEERERFLAEASRALTGSLDQDDLLARLLELIVPRLADYCVIDLAARNGEIIVRRAALRHHDPSKQPLLESLRAFPPRLTHAFGPARVLRTGEPELVEDVTAAWLRALCHDEAHLGILQALGPRSELVVPLTARGRIVGSIGCAFAESGRRYAPECVSLAEDLAGRAALALDNAQLYGEVQRALSLRDRVLGIVAHDLRNPLNTIALAGQALIEMLGEDGRAHRAERKYAALIRRSVERASALIEDLLDVARMQAGAIAVKTGPIEPGAIAREAIALHRPLAEQKHLHLEHEVAGELPEIVADRERILQVLANLLGNAIKFTPEGGRIVVRADRSDGEVHFSVSDSGPGMPSEELAHVFDSFWQGRASGRSSAGLGLTIAKAIVEAHGGHLSVRSRPGEGSTFEFAMPVATSRRAS